MHLANTHNTNKQKHLSKDSIKVLGIRDMMIMYNGSVSTSHVWDVVVEEELIRNYLLVIVNISPKCVVLFTNRLLIAILLVLGLALRFLGGLDGLLPSTGLFLRFFLA